MWRLGGVVVDRRRPEASTARPSTERAAESTERLESLVAECFGPGRADWEAAKYGVHWVITPTDLRPLEDEPAG